MTDTTKTAHTAGPWEVATSCSWRRIVASLGGAGVCIPTIQQSDNHPDLYFPNGGADGPDARLIAASPEMLDALGAVDDAADSMEFDPDSRFGEALTKVRAAWAKATGAPA